MKKHFPLVLRTLVMLCSAIPFSGWAQCTLAIDSNHVTEVTCNGLSNGAVTIYATGGHGSLTYANGQTGASLLSQSFSSSGSVVSTGSTGSTMVWWSPGTCTNSPPWVYTSSQGCPAGSAVFQGTDNSYEGCFLRSPNVNMDNINTVVITMDVTNNNSGASDNIEFYCWVGGDYQTTLPTTVNGVSTSYLYFGTARSCEPVTVTINLSSIPAGSRSDFLFYIQANCENASSCDGYMADVDNVNIAAGAPTQTSSTFSGLSAGNYVFVVTDSTGCTVDDSVTITQPAALSVTPGSIAVTHVGGSNGAAFANPSGGTGPYSYAWNSSPVQHTDTATGLSAGTYTVTVTDKNGCTAAGQATVGSPNCSGFAVANYASTNVLCHGLDDGSIIAYGTGGYPPYQYELNLLGYQNSDTFNNLAAGTYTIHLLDTAGCQASSLVINITQPNALTGSAIVNYVPCHGDTNSSVTIVPNGGTAPYEYSLNNITWQTANTFNSLPPDTYQVTIRDTNGCEAFVTVADTQPPLLTVIIDTITGSGSSGLYAVVNGGTKPYDYAWSNGSTTDTILSLTPGTYCITVVDNNGCTATACRNVNASCSSLAVSSADVDSTNVSCYNGHNGSITVTASGGTSPYQYQLNGGNWQSSGVFDSLVSGSYTVSVRDTNGCIASYPSIITITQPGEPLIINSAEITNERCYGEDSGIIVVFASGGTSPYQYSLNDSTWQLSNFFNNLAANGYHLYVKDARGCTINSNETITQPTQLVVSVSATAASPGQDNGTATATVSGGTPAYTYAWTGGLFGDPITGLAPGLYCITVTDENTCSASACGVVGTTGCPGYHLVLTGTVRDEPCFGADAGYVLVFVQNGYGPYQYSLNGTTWQSNPQFDSLAPGTYIVLAKDTNGCTGNDTLQITQPDQLTVSVITTPANQGVDNGTATANFNGGVSGYSYVWSNFLPGNPLSGLAAGQYCITVTDANNCSATACGVVNSTGCSITVDSVVATSAACVGDSGTIQVYSSGGVHPVIYSINSGSSYQAGSIFTGLAAGSYYVEVRDSLFCDAAYAGNPIILSQPTPVNPGIGSSGNVVSTDNVFSTYAWYFDSTLISGANSFSYTATQTGNYYVIVTDSNGCTGASPILFVIVSGIGGVAGNAGMEIFPNPSEGSFRITLPPGAVAVNVINALGEIVQSREVSGSQPINLTLDVPGLYLIQVSAASGSYTGKVLITR